MEMVQEKCVKKCKLAVSLGFVLIWGNKMMSGR